MGTVIERKPRWYFGGVASAMGVVFTHPLDLIKVHLQTQTGKKVSIVQLTVNVVKKNGVLSLYNGLSASVFRQLTYSTTRFAIYDMVKIFAGKEISFIGRIGLAAFAGSLGGFIGTPSDKVNVRMQNDVKLPPDKRYNYKHVFDGLWKVYKYEGFSKLFSGGSTATLRAAVMGVGQLSVYDQIKKILLSTSIFEDNLGAIATTLAQPLDVMKTRLMNAKPGEFKNIMAVFIYTAKDGPLGFFKGYVPAFLRIGPQTILTFIFYEQLRMHFGVLPQSPKKD